MNVASRLGVIIVLCLVALVFALSCESGGNTSAPQAAAARGNPPSAHIVDPAAVAALPPRFQLSEEKVANIRRVYKVKPDISVNPSKSEKIDCKNCAVIVIGAILYPPFYFTKTEHETYINGYRFWPYKSFPLVWDKKN